MTAQRNGAPVRAPTPIAPALKVRAECPSCHHPEAVVFYAVYASEPRRNARLVCLACCPRVPTDR
jgi:hypothetical protein